MGKIKADKRIWIALGAVLCVALLLLFTHQGKRKEVVLEFGMFTGSNWDVATANSFVIIDKAIARFEAEHPGVRIHYYSGVLKEDYSEWFSRMYSWCWERISTNFPPWAS